MCMCLYLSPFIRIRTHMYAYIYVYTNIHKTHIHTYIYIYTSIYVYVHITEPKRNYIGRSRLDIMEPRHQITARNEVSLNSSHCLEYTQIGFNLGFLLITTCPDHPSPCFGSPFSGLEASSSWNSF